MVGEEFIYVFPEEIISKVKFLISILQIVGVFAILYIVFNIISLFINKKKKTELEKINKNLEEIKILLNRD